MERLAQSDKGVILYRRLLKEQLKIVEDGGDPMNVFRDPDKDLSLQYESTYFPGAPRKRSFATMGVGIAQYTPAVEKEELEALFALEAQVAASS
jgi:5,5'-dehydrodivanillate O-demethylase